MQNIAHMACVGAGTMSCDLECYSSFYLCYIIIIIITYLSAHVQRIKQALGGLLPVRHIYRLYILLIEFDVSMAMYLCVLIPL